MTERANSVISDIIIINITNIERNKADENKLLPWIPYQIIVQNLQNRFHLSC